VRQTKLATLLTCRLLIVEDVDGHGRDARGQWQSHYAGRWSAQQHDTSDHCQQQTADYQRVSTCP